jgi:hypothetical protein
MQRFDRILDLGQVNRFAARITPSSSGRLPDCLKQVSLVERLKSTATGASAASGSLTRWARGADGNID